MHCGGWKTNKINKIPQPGVVVVVERRKTEKEERETNFFLYKNKPRKKSQGAVQPLWNCQLPPLSPPKQTNRNDPQRAHMFHRITWKQKQVSVCNEMMGLFTTTDGDFRIRLTCKCLWVSARTVQWFHGICFVSYFQRENVGLGRYSQNCYPLHSKREPEEKQSSWPHYFTDWRTTKKDRERQDGRQGACCWRRAVTRKVRNK